MPALEYQIRRQMDETTCDQCGQPLYVGDWATFDGKNVFCCDGCADELRPDGWTPSGDDGMDYPD
jgi:hypothetical protein